MTDAPVTPRPMILCIEDEPVIRSVIARVLRRAGYAVVEAADGAQGLRAIRASRPDLVLCDVGLPVIDGLRVLDAVRAGEAGDPGLPFVMLSALAEPGDAAEAMRRGADAYVGKPVDLDGLLAVLAERLSRR
ncbi:response regulator [Arenibaculum sp.]|uniref:response regulator n=1 Tax=Arenibaculum sp. TaxID=2865862 RepID=UPI002E10C50C|nr:response regulator [Arenibaculum sp.]